MLHDDGTTAIYAHLQMDTIRVRPGQRVERGEYIANSGNTGFSSGPHLHFVVVRNAGFQQRVGAGRVRRAGWSERGAPHRRRADGLLSRGPGPQRADEFAERGEWRRAGHAATQIRDRVLLRPLGGEAFGQIRRIVRNGRHEAPRIVELVEFGAPGVEILARPA